METQSFLSRLAQFVRDCQTLNLIKDDDEVNVFMWFQDTLLHFHITFNSSLYHTLDSRIALIQKFMENEFGYPLELITIKLKCNGDDTNEFSCNLPLN